uniref:Uncharacterized protein n=1 Tax=Arundo donax TaxID=35708 RepID=A0A0A9F7D1_ARUDO
MHPVLSLQRKIFIHFIRAFGFTSFFYGTFVATLVFSKS